MKIYNKPEIDIVKFDIGDSVITVSIGTEDGFDMQSDEVFYGIEAGEEGYISQ